MNKVTANFNEQTIFVGKPTMDCPTTAAQKRALIRSLQP
jgi:hypothetical protein